MLNGSALRWYRCALVVADTILLSLAFVGAALLRGAIDVLPIRSDFDPRHYAFVAVGLVPGLLVILWLRGAYHRSNLLGGPQEYVRVVSAATYGILFVVGASYVYGSLPLVSRSWLLVFWGLTIVLIGAGRFTLRRVAYALRCRGLFVRRVLIAGANEQGLAIAQQLESAAEGVTVVGFLDDYVSVGSVVPARPAGQDPAGHGQYRVVGHPREAAAIAQMLQVDILVGVPSALSWESQHVMAQLAEMTESQFEVLLAPTHHDLHAVQVQPAPLGFVPLVRLQPARLLGIDAFLRASVDVTVGVLLLVAFGPALIVALGVGQWRGVRPLWLRREVLGSGGRPVVLHLLNPQVTDWLLLRGVPALWPVLRGQLALVGPRPVLTAERADYSRWLSLLLSVPPGLTGPWRLAHPHLPLEERVLSDVWWVRNWSVWQHLFVLAKSAHAVCSGSGPAPEIQRWEAAQPSRVEEAIV